MGKRVSPGTCLTDIKKRLRTVILVVGILAAFGIIYLLIVRFFDIGIPCNLRRLTGILCPGCGMTRAVFSILRGDFQSAFSYNALSLTLAPLAAIYVGFRAYKYIFDVNYKTHPWEYFLWAGFAIWILVFTVLRNL